MKHSANIMAYILVAITALAGMVGCDNNDPKPITEKLTLSVVWTNEIDEPLYISTGQTNPQADVVCYLTDTVLAPGASITVATASKEISYLSDNEKSEAHTSLFDALQSSVGSFSIKYTKANTLYKISSTPDNRLFSQTDYAEQDNRLALSITEERIKAAGATAVEGIARELTIRWDMKTTVPVTLAISTADKELLNREVKPGEMEEIVKTTYREYDGENDITSASRRDALNDLVGSIVKIEVKAPNLLSANHNTDTTFSIADAREHIFDIQRYTDDNDTYTIPVYNETLFVEYRTMTNDNWRRNTYLHSWENGMDKDMVIDLRYREHLTMSIGETLIQTTIAPGETLQLNPLIVYHEEGVKYVVSQESVAWEGYIAEIEHLSIKYGDKEYTLDPKQPAEFISTHQSYENGVYRFTEKSFQ